MCVSVCVIVIVIVWMLGGGLRGGEEKQNNRCFLGVNKNAATAHEIDHYPSTVYHHVVDKSMSDGDDSVLHQIWSTQTVCLLTVETAREHSGQGCS